MGPAFWAEIGVAGGLLIAAGLAGLEKMVHRTRLRRPVGRDRAERGPGSTVAAHQIGRDLSSAVGDLADATAVLASAGARLQGCRARLEDESAAAWQTLQDTRQFYLRLVDRLLLMRDHLDGRCEPADGPEAGALGMCRAQLEKTMAECRIDQCVVEPEAAFDAELHHIVEVKEDGRREGTVLDVCRPGYMTTLPGAGRILLRKADVIVSSGTGAPPGGRKDEAPHDE